MPCDGTGIESSMPGSNWSERNGSRNSEALSSGSFILREGGLIKKKEHRTSNVQHRILNGKRWRIRNSHSRTDIGFLKTNGTKLRSPATSLFDVQRWTFDVRRSIYLLFRPREVSNEGKPVRLKKCQIPKYKNQNTNRHFKNNTTLVPIHGFIKGTD
mgnify:CR=1 FL=1